MDPAFYQPERLRWVNERDWKLRRQDERRLRDAAKVPDRILPPKRLAGNKDVADSIESLRKALAQFRTAVGKLGKDDAADKQNR
jgi:hypothetical protein